MYAQRMNTGDGGVRKGVSYPQWFTVACEQLGRQPQIFNEGY